MKSFIIRSLIMLLAIAGHAMLAEMCGASGGIKRAIATMPFIIMGSIPFYPKRRV